MAASKFTPENRGALIERFAAGCSLPDAASACGLNETTVKKWLTRGRREDAGSYAEFAAAADQTRAEARARPEPMDKDELALVVSEAARLGNTQAMKLRWEMLRTAEEPGDQGAAVDPLAALDELAERRSVRA